MHKAAGGTSHRLNPSPATIRSLDRSNIVPLLPPFLSSAVLYCADHLTMQRNVHVPRLDWAIEVDSRYSILVRSRRLSAQGKHAIALYMHTDITPNEHSTGP